MPAGGSRLVLCKHNLPLGSGRNKAAVYDKFPGLHTEVGLAAYVQQIWETHYSTLPAVGCFLCLSMSPFAKRRLSLGGCATGWMKEANRKE